jgi:hypothetical protein
MAAMDGNRNKKAKPQFINDLEVYENHRQSALARQMNGANVKILPVVLTGGSPPAILADIQYADLNSDWDSGVRQLLKAIR